MSNEEETQNFIEEIIEEDLAANKNNGRVHTRFPPEPNGYLHIGHAKSICLNFRIAEKYNGLCNLRFDDTNPLTEEEEYVASIKEDVQWLGYDWGDRLYFASDYFDQLYDFAVLLIKAGKAYVCDLPADEISRQRGGPNERGIESPWRDRSVEENLELFERMKNGEFEDGARCLRAKIDMAAENLNMRDPVIYRIKNASHPRTGDKWAIYPTYDFAHGQCDSIEGITHSLCSLEFMNHRPLYDWLIEQLGIHHPQQIEFARLNLSYVVLSKRNLQELVSEGYVEGWDDPRMPTISGMRRRGYPPTAIRRFCEQIGVARFNSVIDVELLFHFVRDELNSTAPRVMGVLRPLKVVITNYPEGETEYLEAENNPEDPNAGTRQLPFSREIYVEQNDFREDPPRKFFRLAPGKEVRLKHAYFITCEEVIKDENGEVVELRCRYDPASRGGASPDGRKVKGTLQWVSTAHALNVQVRLYDRLFKTPEPADVDEEAGENWLDNINPESLEVIDNCKLEPSMKDAPPGSTCQFLRQGYYCVDTKDSSPGNPVFNQTVTLKDTWAKIEQKQKQNQ